MTTVAHSPALTTHAPPAPPRVKRAVAALLWLWVAPRIVLYRVLHRFIGPERAMNWLSESITAAPGPLGVLLRAAAYRRVLSHVGRDVSIGYGTLLSKQAAVISDRAYVGRHCTLGWVTLGPDVHIADGAQLLSGSAHHRTAGGVTYQHITIGAGAWIGAGAIVMADVGAGAIVGAGAVVTRSVAAGTTVVGVPARPVEKA